MEVDAGALLRVLASFLPQQRSALQKLQDEVAELELRQRLGQLLPSVRQVPVAALLSERRDLVIVGERGTGKTCLAFAAALEAVDPKGNPRQVIAVDWTGPLPDGVDRCTQREAPRQKGAVLVYDEAALRIGVGKRSMAVWDIMALARQRDQCIVWTSQAAAAVDLFVLRQGVTIVWLPGESRFERPELEREAVVARHLLKAGNAERGTWVAQLDGQWCVGRATPPAGWSENVSRAWA